MLIPVKNREFLLFIVERILEFVDERNTEIKYYVTNDDAVESRKSPKDFKDVLNRIVKDYTTLDENTMKNHSKGL